MKYIKKLLPLVILLLFLISMLIFADIVIESVSFAIDICINNIGLSSELVHHKLEYSSELRSVCNVVSLKRR